MNDERGSMMMDIFEFYDKMERNNIMLSFKGDISSELLTSILQIMESKMENLSEPPKMRKKVYNVLVECLQNLYHHMDEVPVEAGNGDENDRSAIFMIGKVGDNYRIVTGNYMYTKNVSKLRNRIDTVNSMNRDELKAYYKEVLNNGEMSAKGGGGLGMIDISRKSGQKLDYNFMSVDESCSFFTLNIKITTNKKENITK